MGGGGRALEPNMVAHMNVIRDPVSRCGRWGPKKGCWLFRFSVFKKK
jgi:hypothetical protein